MMGGGWTDNKRELCFLLILYNWSQENRQYWRAEPQQIISHQINLHNISFFWTKKKVSWEGGGWRWYESISWLVPLKLGGASQILTCCHIIKSRPAPSKEREIFWIPKYLVINSSHRLPYHQEQTCSFRGKGEFLPSEISCTKLQSPAAELSTAEKKPWRLV